MFAAARFAGLLTSRAVSFTNRPEALPTPQACGSPHRYETPTHFGAATSVASGGECHAHGVAG
jgi:hypothetical protein